MASIYDSADVYDLIENEERFQAYKRHWEFIFKENNPKTMLDVSIGSGSVTIPVLELGVKLSGSDLSETMLEKCKKKISERGYTPILKQSDFRDLSCWGDEKFDIVASTGNSIAYVSNEDVKKTLEEMDKHVANGGILYIDIRNWDKILKERNRFYLYNPFFVDDFRVNFVQAWDYNADGSMDFNLLYTFERDNKMFRKEEYKEHYIPASNDLIVDKLKSMGYEVSLYPFPANFPMIELEKLEWYTIIAKKK